MKKKTVKEKETVIKIPPVNLALAKITLKGTTPPLVHKFSEKCKKEIEDKHQKLGKAKKEARDPEKEFRESLYVIPGKKNTYGIPASGVKNAAVSAARFIDGLKMTTLKGSFHVIDDVEGLIPIVSKKGPVMDSRMVRIGNFGNKISTPRYRGRFDDWEISFTVKYNPSIVSTTELLHLYENAGFSVGLCEHRPEKSGNLGMFEVKRS